MTIKASWERLFGHDGDGEPPGRPVNWEVKLASMRAPVVLHEGGGQISCMSVLKRWTTEGA